jgi:WD40 repeat protein
MAFKDSNNHAPVFTKLNYKGCSLLPSNPSKFFVIGTSDGHLILVDSDSNEIKCIRPSNLPSIYCMVYDVSFNIWAGGDKEIHLYVFDAMESGTIWAPTKRLKNHEDTVISLKFFGSELVSASEDAQILTWNLNTNQSRKIILLDSPILSFDLCVESKRIAASTSDNILALVKIEKEEKFEENVDEKVWALRILSKSNRLVTGDHCGNITLRNLDDFNAIKYVQMHESRVKSLFLSRNEKYLVSGSFDQKVKLSKIEDMEVFGEYEHSDWVRCVAIDEPFLKIISISDDERFGCVDFRNFKGKNELIERFTQEIQSEISNVEGSITNIGCCSFIKSKKTLIIGVFLLFIIILLLKYFLLMSSRAL